MTHHYHRDTIAQLAQSLGSYETFALDAAHERDYRQTQARRKTFWTAPERADFARQATEADAVVQAWTAQAADIRRLLALIAIEQADEKPDTGWPGCAPSGLDEFRLDTTHHTGAHAFAEQLLERLDREPDLVGDTAGPPVDHSALRARAGLERSVIA
jgi:hypothetical protein